MTSIAWDGISLAGDSQITENGIVICNRFKKVRRVRADLNNSKVLAVGIAGNMDGFNKIVNWLKSGCKPSFPESIDAAGIIVTEKAAYAFDSGTGGALFKLSDCYSVGTGMPLCISAMKLGLSAREAVKHAVSLDVYSSGKITEINCRG